MEIINQGDLQLTLSPKTFTCLKCGCVFKAECNEYIVGPSWRNLQTYTCWCPCCNDEVYLEE
jgi:hypothetical protein